MTSFKSRFVPTETYFSPYYNFTNNIYVNFSRRGGDDGDKTGQLNVAIAPGWNSLGVIGNFTFSNDVFYDFRIVDTGSNITLFLGDMGNPFLTVDTTERTGYQIGMENRGVVPWFPTYDNQVKLDYIKVSTVPDGGSTVGLLSIVFLGAVALRRMFGQS